MPYIFDRYYRSRSDAGKQGTGLGLSITKAIFQQHSFRFGVQSTVGKGTTFRFNRKLCRYAKGSPFGRAGALAPERASTLKIKASATKTLFF